MPQVLSLILNSQVTKQKQLVVVLLMLSVMIGLLYRFISLERLPPWTDEMATMVFSLGKNFHSVPLNQIVSREVLLEPLIVESHTNLSSVWENLMADSTHPPLYFWLCHLWIRLFAEPGQVLGIWLARSLSALLGLGAIACTVGLAWLVSHSRKVMIWTCIFATLSPFSIFLARQARHYTFGMIWVSGAIVCLVLALERSRRSQSIPPWLIGVWIVTNILGMATHYFFALSILAQGIVVLMSLLQRKKLLTQWLPFIVVAIGSLVAVLVWLPAVQSANGTSPTQWIYGSQLKEPWMPLLWLLMWTTSMVTMSPSAVTAKVPLWLIILSGIILLGFLIVFVPKCWQALQRSMSPSIRTLVEYVLMMIGLFLFVNYGLGISVTVASRFSFLWFPAFIVIIGIAASRFTQLWAIAIMLTMAIIGSCTTMMNLGYLQHERVDLLAKVIAQKTQTHRPLIVIPHKHHGQTGRLMGLAWEFRNQTSYPQRLDPEFFLAEGQPVQPDNFE